jgi:hypothetical protein
MKRIMSALALVTVAALSAVACSGDDDATSNTTGGTGNTAGKSASSAGQPTSGGDTGVPAGGAATGNVMCDPSQKGVCQNPTDCPSVASGAARMAAGMCGQGCLGNKNKNCAVDCIVKQTSMSSGCATCYAAAVDCATKNCLAQCINDPESVECKTCQVEKGCRADFNTCSGLPE